MNKRGVALAADSAVTLGDGHKVYHTADKLFQLSSAPVGIMTYGVDQIMGVPWETVIKLYARRLGGRRFDRLEQYAQDFLRFIEGSELLFPESAQREAFQELVGSYWAGCYLRPLTERLHKAGKGAAKNANPILAELIVKDHETEWKGHEPLEEMGDSYGDRVIAQYDGVLGELETELFGRFNLSPEVRGALRTTARYMYALDAFSSEASSGVVIGGIGEAEAFPVVLLYQVGSLAAGRLRFTKLDEGRVGEGTDGILMPFAQRHVIDMLYGGISPLLKEKLVEIVGDNLAASLKGAGKTGLALKRREQILESFNRAAQQHHTAPLTRALAALPRRELARLAEALVSLTVFMARISAEQEETVGGPIDVAMICKGEGFVWIKRKDPVGGGLIL